MHDPSTCEHKHVFYHQLVPLYLIHFPLSLQNAYSPKYQSKEVLQIRTNCLSQGRVKCCLQKDCIIQEECQNA